MSGIVLRLVVGVVCFSTVPSIAQIYHEALDTSRLPFMHLVSPCSTGATSVSSVCNINNRTVLIGGLGRIGWVNDSATDVAWECSPTQEAFVHACTRDGVLLTCGEKGNVWIRSEDGTWTRSNRKFGNTILDATCTDNGWFVLNDVGEIYHTNTLTEDWKVLTIDINLSINQPVKFDVRDSTVVVCLTNGRWTVSNDLGNTWHMGLDTLSKWHQWKTVYAASNGSWYLGGGGASVWLLDSTLLHVKTKFELFEPWTELDAGYKPDEVLQISEIDSVGIVVCVNGYRVRQREVNHMGLFTKRFDDTVWVFHGFSEQSSEQMFVPTDPGVGAFRAKSGQLCGVAGSSVNGIFITSIQRSVSGADSLGISWYHCAQGNIGIPDQNLYPAFIAPTYRDIIAVDDHSALVTYVRSNSENGSQNSYDDSCRVRYISVTADSIVVEERPAFPSMTQTLQVNRVLFGVTPQGDLIRSPDGRQFDTVTNLPFTLGYVDATAFNGGVFAVTAATVNDPDSSYWKRRLFKTSDGGETWAVLDVTLPHTGAIWAELIAVGADGSVVGTVALNPTGKQEDAERRVILWDSLNRSTQLPKLPDQITVASARGLVCISFHNNAPILWMQQQDPGMGYPLPIVVEFVDNQWQTRTPRFFIASTEVQIAGGFHSVKYLDNLVYLKSAWNDWISMDDGYTFTRFEDPLQGLSSINEVARIGNRYIILGENGLLATSLAPLVTSVRRGYSDKPQIQPQGIMKLGHWECGTALGHVDEAASVEVFSVTGQLVAFYDLSITPHPLLDCTSVCDAFIAVVTNHDGVVIEARRVVK